MRTNIILGFVLAALVLPLGSSGADMSEWDRLARCGNNRERLTTLEQQYASYASDEDIARLRAALLSVREHFAHILNSPFEKRSALDRQEWEHVQSLAREGPCDYSVDLCLKHLEDELEMRIDAAVRQMPQRNALGREIFGIRGRMIELQCDAPAPPSPQNVSASGWQPAGAGDCPGEDEASSSGASPDPGMCTASRAGKAAVCWDGQNYVNHYGETHGAPPYPWCTYKSTGTCSGGSNVGTLYYCRP